MNFFGIFYVLFLVIVLADGAFKLTNMKCEEFDKPFATIPTCKLKMIQRNLPALYLIVKLHQVPVNNVTVRSFSDRNIF